MENAKIIFFRDLPPISPNGGLIKELDFKAPQMGGWRVKKQGLGRKIRKEKITWIGSFIAINYFLLNLY
jgi:hypothetical protein